MADVKDYSLLMQPSISDILGGEGQESWMWNLLKEAGFMKDWLGEDEAYDIGLTTTTEGQKYLKGGDPYATGSSSAYQTQGWNPEVHKQEFSPLSTFEGLSDLITSEDFMNMQGGELEKYIYETMYQDPALKKQREKGFYKGSFGLGGFEGTGDVGDILSGWSYGKGSTDPRDAAYGQMEELGFDPYSIESGYLDETIAGFVPYSKTKEFDASTEGTYDPETPYGEWEVTETEATPGLQTLYDDYLEYVEGLGTDVAGYEEAKGVSMNEFLEMLEGQEEFDPMYSDVIDVDPSESAGLTNLLMSLQEGMKGAPTAESWGLGRKVEDVETSLEREKKSLLQEQIDTSFGRYDVLAGTKTPEELKLEKSDYLSNLYGKERVAGRDIESIYDKYLSDYTGSIGQWLQGLSG